MFDNATAISHVLRDAISRHAAAKRTAICGPGGSTSYVELARLIDRYAGGIRAWGVARGEPIGLLTARSVDAIALFFGAMQAGACPCFIEPKLAHDALADDRHFRRCGLPHYSTLL